MTKTAPDDLNPSLGAEETQPAASNGQEIGTFPVAAQVEAPLLEPAEAEHVLKIRAAERAARGGVEAARETIDETLDAAQEAISAVAAKTVETVDRLRFKAREAAYAAREGLGELKQQTAPLREDVDRYVRQSPLRAAAISAGIGLLVGMVLLGRDARRSGKGGRRRRGGSSSKKSSGS